MIPRRFFWLFDLVVILAAHSITPLFGPQGVMHSSWIEAVFSPYPSPFPLQRFCLGWRDDGSWRTPKYYIRHLIMSANW